MMSVKRIRIPEHVRKQLIACAAQEQETGRPAKLVLYPRSLSRQYSHRTLIRALIEVIERDDSLSKLYAGLLAKQVLNREPKLQRQYSRQLADV
jgi:hypothetical protein